jgi:antitoxin MazE
LNLKEGEEIELYLLGERSLAVARKDTPEQMLERLRALRGRLPVDFHFDRQEAQGR